MTKSGKSLTRAVLGITHFQERTAAFKRAVQRYDKGFRCRPRALSGMRVIAVEAAACTIRFMRRNELSDGQLRKCHSDD
jgi:hypothetical protein